MDEGNSGLVTMVINSNGARLEFDLEDQVWRDESGRLMPLTKLAKNPGCCGDLMSLFLRSPNYRVTHEAWDLRPGSSRIPLREAVCDLRKVFKRLGCTEPPIATEYATAYRLFSAFLSRPSVWSAESKRLVLEPPSIALRVKAFDRIPNWTASGEMSYPGESVEQRKQAPEILGKIDLEAYQSSDTFDPDEVLDLLKRFPRAVVLLGDRERSTGFGGYFSAFPIRLETASVLSSQPTHRDFALPCTCHDRSRALFLTSDVPGPSEIPAEVAWYLDSLVNLSRSVAGLTSLITSAYAEFRYWSERCSITDIYTISVSGNGENLVGMASLFLASLGFAPFKKQWAVNHYVCWRATRLAGPNCSQLKQRSPTGQDT